MKKFIYTRLLEDGYGFHVSPTGSGPFNKVLELATDASTRGDGKRVILLSEKGKTIIAIREELSLKDKGGRTRNNLIGYQLEPGEPIPFFDAVKKRLDAINAEVLAAHAKLDENPLSGKSLQHTDIAFEQGNYTAGNAWDEAVRAINASPDKPRLFIGDVHGAGREHPPEPKSSPRAASAPKTSAREAELPEGERAARPEAIPEPPKKKPSWSGQADNTFSAASEAERLGSSSRLAMRCLAVGGVLMAVVGTYSAAHSVKKDPNTGEVKRNWVSTVIGGAGAAAGAALAVWGLRR
jgi:hypothetical protein